MIVSYQHNFIFIRTRKTASTSIEAVLRTALGPNDWYVSDNQIRSVASKPDTELSVPARGHIAAKEIRTLVPKGFWRRACKITAERHPYEKAVSLAYYNFAVRNQKEWETPDFAEFLDRVVRKGAYRSFDHYSISGQVVADDFIRYETLEDDLRTLARKLGIEIPVTLPNLKSAFHGDRRPAHEILTSEQRRTVFETCREEFALHGYEA